MERIFESCNSGDGSNRYANRVTTPALEGTLTKNWYSIKVVGWLYVNPYLQEPISRPNFSKAYLVCFAEIMHYDWLKISLWLGTFNESILFSKTYFFALKTIGYNVQNLYGNLQSKFGRNVQIQMVYGIGPGLATPHMNFSSNNST